MTFPWDYAVVRVGRALAIVPYRAVAEMILGSHPCNDDRFVAIVVYELVVCGSVADDHAMGASGDPGEFPRDADPPADQALEIRYGGD